MKKPRMSPSGVLFIAERPERLFVVAVLICIWIKEVFWTKSIFVNAVDGVGRCEALTLCLTLGFFSRTGNVEFNLKLNFSMKVKRNIVQTNGLDRCVELDLVAADVEAFGAEDFNNVASSNGCQR